jgi:hypothetical protein
MILNPIFRDTAQYKERSWFTLHESVKVWHDSSAVVSVMGNALYLGDNEVDPWDFSIASNEEWLAILNSCYGKTGYIPAFYNPSDSWADETMLKAFRSLEMRYGNRYASSIDSEDEGDSDALRFEFTRSLVNLINKADTSYREYKPILKAYEERENGLLAQISSTSTANSRFNDTPQNGGSWEDDNHTTNITQMTNTSASDGDTPVRRLEEVRRLWRSVFDEWVDELATVLVEGSNL